jgi:hypothetical protein
MASVSVASSTKELPPSRSKIRSADSYTAASERQPDTLHIFRELLCFPLQGFPLNSHPAQCFLTTGARQSPGSPLSEERMAQSRK